MEKMRLNAILCLVALMGIFAIPTYGADGFSNNEGGSTYKLHFEYVTNSSGDRTVKLVNVEITKADKFSGRIDIRDWYQWGLYHYTVVEIADNAFSNVKNDITEFHCCINIMDDNGKDASDNYATHITKIGNSAFAGCSKLTTVELPTSITSMGTGVFSNCSSLTTIWVGESGTTKLYQQLPQSIKVIPANTFQNCTSLGSYRFESNVTGIGYRAFFNSGLTSASLYSTSISGIALGDLMGSTTSGSQFENCTKLTSVNLNDKITRLPNKMFSGCTKLSSIYTWDVTEIGQSTFYGCSALRTLTCGSALRIIGNLAFNGCSNLYYADLNEGLTNISTYAFQNCTSLPKVVFPSTLSYVAENAYKGCSGMKLIDTRKLTAVTAADVNGKFYSTAFNDATLCANARLLVNFGAEEGYHTANATAAITHLIADCPTQDVTTVLSDGLTGYHYRLGSDDVANYAGNIVTKTGTTYAYNQATLTTLDGTVPAGLKAYAGIDQLSSKGYHYDRTTWLALEDVNMAGSVMGKNNTLLLKDKVNPTFAFESGYDINDSYSPINAFSVGATTTGTYAANTYCPSNFVEQSETWFVEPQPCEVATVTWAVYAGDNTFYVPAKTRTAAGWINEDEQNGGFTIGRDYLNTESLPGDDFVEGMSYTFTGVIKRQGSNNAPRRADTFTPRTDGGASTTWVIAPIDVTKVDNVVTGIDDVSATSAITNVTYYNLAGQAATTPHAGINIVATRHTDGTVTTAKVVF